MGRIATSACLFCKEWGANLLQAKHEANRKDLVAGTTTRPTGTLALFRRHLGHHLEQMALFALPINDNEDVQNTTGLDQNSDNDDDSIKDDDMDDDEDSILSQDEDGRLETSTKGPRTKHHMLVFLYSLMAIIDTCIAIAQPLMSDNEIPQPIKDAVKRLPEVLIALSLAENFIKTIDEKDSRREFQGRWL